MSSKDMPIFRSRTLELPNALVVQTMAQWPPEDVHTTTTVTIKDTGEWWVHFGHIWLPHDLIVAVARGSAETFAAPHDRLDEIKPLMSVPKDGTEQALPTLLPGAGQVIVPAGYAWMALCTRGTVLTCFNYGAPGHNDRWGVEARLRPRQD